MTCDCALKLQIRTESESPDTQEIIPLVAVSNIINITAMGLDALLVRRGNATISESVHTVIACKT